MVNLTFAGMIKLGDKEFRPYIDHDELIEKIKIVAEKINKDYKGKKPIFLAVLNGSFMFAADLMKNISLDCEISFIRVSSYSGTSTTGIVKEVLGLDMDLGARDVIILEDIVDTGTTLETLHKVIKGKQPSSIKTACLLFKPEAYKKPLPVEYPAIEIPEKFIVGFGLDYDGMGRNLRHIYVLNES